ncbi:hypothetical protein Q5752_001953 [Cryptotrichosporon argae]
MPAALIIVDVQNDFLPPGGALAVPGGRDVLAPIAALLDGSWGWDVVVVAQDYHPAHHISFASAHVGGRAFETRDVVDARGTAYAQTLWPDHCVAGRAGAEVAREVQEALAPWAERGRVVRKGWHENIEAYSAFEGYLTNLRAPAEPPAQDPPPPQLLAGETELARFLRARGIDRVAVVGLATDYCIRDTSVSALAAAFNTAVLAPAARAISADGGAAAFAKVEALGGQVCESADELRRFVAS